MSGKKKALWSHLSRMSKRYSLAEAFILLATKRRSAWEFADRAVSRKTLRRLLLLTQLAPTSFNLQPYEMLVSSSNEAKDALASCMVGGNRGKVLASSLSVVFLAHKDPYRLHRKLMALEEANGAEAGYVGNLPAQLVFLVGSGFLSHKIRKLSSHLASPLTPVPVIPFAPQWAEKQGMFAAQQLLLAASSLGLRTAPMEGFDERRVCFQLGVPLERFSVPLVVSVGYAKDSPAEDTEEDSENEADLTEALRRRYKLEDICHENKYGNKFKA